ncbi:Cof-type HAD-IIB family hydrolase [Allofustis seminis]|uniref:Cof-type HAD-IIB family hydrolase n=1 Tax=Allofustis seminis TaxID=166939 RepID=UPI00036F41EC|nr:Cof-type HAD-IIB family hydrolase [Allofustis seminis]
MLFKKFDIRLIVTDLDGTLLANDGSVPRENVEMIEMAKASGIQVVICTGRPLRSMQYLLDALNFTDKNDLVCTYNGGLIQYALSGEVLHQETLSISDAKEMENMASGLNLPLCLVDLDAIYELPYPENAPSVYQLNRRYNPQDDGGLKFRSIQLEQMPADWAINKMVIARPKNELDAATPNIPKKYFEKYNIFKTQPDFLEIVSKKANKGYAIKYLQEHLNLKPSQIMGIGDQENDISLIEAAGFGVAMGNAIAPAKEVAQFVTKTNEEAGFAYAVQKILSE